MTHAKMTFSLFKGMILPLVLWMIFTPWSNWFDLKMSQFFFHDGSFVFHPFLDWIFIYCTWPAWLIAAIAGVGLLLSFFKSNREWRIPCLYLLLTFAIGSGLIIHVILKDHWGRPRPRQVVNFGGKQTFRPYYQPNFTNQPEPSKSFACGHASLGFFFFALALLGVIYRSQYLYWLGHGCAWTLGSLLSFGRIAQGGHFFSDTLASALIMWLTAWGLAYFFYMGQKNERVNSKTA